MNEWTNRQADKWTNEQRGQLTNGFKFSTSLLLRSAAVCRLLCCQDLDVFIFCWKITLKCVCVCDGEREERRDTVCIRESVCVFVIEREEEGVERMIKKEEREK